MLRTEHLVATGKRLVVIAHGVMVLARRRARLHRLLGVWVALAAWRAARLDYHSTSEDGLPPLAGLPLIGRPQHLL
ncbi:MAG: hypothetical protein J2P54_07705 [Bradyrhizobiaceae bacterium]|nr:hypothetical protein [Bradyrhizobiaceae bacterium]